MDVANELRCQNPCQINNQIHSPSTNLSGMSMLITRSKLILKQTNFQPPNQKGGFEYKLLHEGKLQRNKVKLMKIQ